MDGLKPQMPLETRISIEIDGVPLPSHLMENIEKAERNIRETHGKNPPMSDLFRMWLATAPPGGVRAEFERTVLSMKRSRAKPNKDGIFDEDTVLNFEHRSPEKETRHVTRR